MSTHYRPRLWRLSQGGFERGVAQVSGELYFESEEIGGAYSEKRVAFCVPVWLFDSMYGGGGGPVFPSYRYGTKFEVSGRNYERRVSIAQAIHPGAVDRFQVQIGMARSAQHIFSVKMSYNGGRVFNGPEVSLTGFVSRTGSQYISEILE